MELSWSTFLLEIINFLVLVWILKHFFYQPILNIIEKRRENIDQIISSANTTRTEAEDLQQRYEARLTEWDKEKRIAEENLQKELQEKQRKLLQQLNNELEKEREKSLAVEQRRQAELQQDYQSKAFRQGARFASKLLHSAATPELENKLIELLLTQLSTLSGNQASVLQKACEPAPERIEISSAYPLGEARRRDIAQAMQHFCPESIPVEYVVDADLVAGLRITLGACVLGMNIQDELEGFAALSPR